MSRVSLWAAVGVTRGNAPLETVDAGLPLTVRPTSGPLAALVSDLADEVLLNPFRISSRDYVRSSQQSYSYMCSSPARSRW